VGEGQKLRLEILDSRACLVQFPRERRSSTLVDFVRKLPDALEDPLVLPKHVGLPAPKLHELRRKLLYVRLSLSGHVSLIGRKPVKHEDPPKRAFTQ